MCTECGNLGYVAPSQIPMIRPGHPVWPSYIAELYGRLDGSLDDPFDPRSLADPSRSSLLPSPSSVDPSRPELLRLSHYLEEAQKVFPRTHFCIPLLSRRAARLYAHDRIMSLGAIRNTVELLKHALCGYESLTSSLVPASASCAIAVSVLQSRVLELQAIAKQRPVYPRIQALRKCATGRQTPKQVEDLCVLTRGEVQDTDEMLRMLYRECRGDLWERYQKVKEDLELMLRIVDPTGKWSKVDEDD